jgi:hypothetical protein
MKSAWNENLCLPEYFSVRYDRLKYLAWIISNRQTHITTEMNGNLATHNGINWIVFLILLWFYKCKMTKKEIYVLYWETKLSFLFCFHL